jgi:hypothetical protein
MPCSGELLDKTTPCATPLRERGNALAWPYSDPSVAMVRSGEFALQGSRRSRAHTWVVSSLLFRRASAVQHREMQCHCVMALPQPRAGAQLMSKVAPVMTRRRRPVQAASAACAACQRTRRQRAMHRLCRPDARRTSSPRTTEFSRRSSRRCLQYCAASFILLRHGASQPCARAAPQAQHARRARCCSI